MSSTSVSDIFSGILTLYGDATITVLTAIFGLAAVILAANFGWKEVKRKVGPIK
jgi:hypothetical protein